MSGVIRCATTLAIGVAFMEMVGNTTTIAAHSSPVPHIAMSDRLGQTFVGPSHAVATGSHGQIFTAWSVDPYAGPSYIARVNSRGTKVRVLTTLPGRAKTLVAGPGNNLFVDLGADSDGSGQPDTLVKLTASGRAVYQVSIPITGISGVAVDAYGNAYITGTTAEPGLATPGAYQTALPSDGAAYIRKLDPRGKTLYSTYLGPGVSQSTAIAVSSMGDAYITGRPSDDGHFPLVNAAQNSKAAIFVAKLNSSGSALVYSTYLGPHRFGYNYGSSDIAVDSAGAAYVTGYARAGFPVTPDAFQKKFGAGRQDPASIDAFVTKLSPAGARFVYTTYLGGEHSEFASAIRVDSRGRAVVVGGTDSSRFPVKHPLQTKLVPGRCTNGNNNWYPCDDGFVSVLNRDGTGLIFSTYLGASGYDDAEGLTLEPNGRATLQVVSDSYNLRAHRSPRFTGITAPQCHYDGMTPCTSVFVATITGLPK